MADTYEKDLAQKSSLTVNDFIRVVGTNNVSYKQLVSDVAKKIIENYIGSSLAGSSQSVKSALDALNSNFTSYEDTVAEDASALCLGKFNRVLSKGTGCYFVNGGWKSRAFGYSIISVLSTTYSRGIVLFVGQDNIYHAYINNGEVAVIKKVTETSI